MSGDEAHSTRDASSRRKDLSTIQHHHCAVNVIWTGPRLVDVLLDRTCPGEELGKTRRGWPTSVHRLVKAGRLTTRKLDLWHQRQRSSSPSLRGCRCGERPGRQPSRPVASLHDRQPRGRHERVTSLPASWARELPIRALVGLEHHPARALLDEVLDIGAKAPDVDVLPSDRAMAGCLLAPPGGE